MKTHIKLHKMIIERKDIVTTHKIFKIPFKFNDISFEEGIPEEVCVPYLQLVFNKSGNGSFCKVGNDSFIVKESTEEIEKLISEAVRECFVSYKFL